MPEIAEHLRHMTDGHWHDGCQFCLQRRQYGGNGILVGQCGDDPREWRDGRLLEHRRDCIVGQHRARAERA